MPKKTVLVTGGTRGIGYAIAEKFASQGFNAVINGIDSERGQAAQKQLQDKGMEVFFVQGDVTKEEQVKALINKAVEKYGAIDVLVNNAGGLGGRCKVEVMEESFYDKVMDLNMKSALFVTREAIPYLKKTKGSIVNITSIADRNGGGPGGTIYAASKAALLTFTRGLAKELIADGIRVNAVAPGTIDTDFHSATAQEVKDAWLKNIPAGRFGISEEIANAVYFLASPEASFIVGEEMHVNGGQMFL